jgi:hypothetical protein
MFPNTAPDQAVHALSINSQMPPRSAAHRAARAISRNTAAAHLQNAAKTISRTQHTSVALRNVIAHLIARFTVEICSFSSDVCEEAAYCTGSNAPCPSNPLSPPTKLCHASASFCEKNVTCSGNTSSCDSPFKGTDTICRMATSNCSNATCQPDGSCLFPNQANCFFGVFIESTGISCSTNDACCFQNFKLIDNTTCSAETSCRFSGKCTNGTCISMAKVDGTNCAAAGVQGPCDAGSICVQGSCAASYSPATAICRPSTGACDKDGSFFSFFVFRFTNSKITALVRAMNALMSFNQAL